jgi:uncharacterized protein
VIFSGSHFVGGALLGIAGSLHCAGVCGGIASSLLLATSPAGDRYGAVAQNLIKIQLGRAASYTLFGAAVGGGGSAFAQLLGLSGTQLIFRGIAACMLIWAGCSVAGMAKSWLNFDKALTALTRTLRIPVSAGRASNSPIFMGIVWGFAPCGMVYAALLNAMMTGSSMGGMQFMGGFGLATIPAVAMTSLGFTHLAGLRHSLQQAMLRKLLGGAIAALGMVSLVDPAMSLSALCLGR